jgi:hypothetical protein
VGRGGGGREGGREGGKEGGGVVSVYRKERISLCALARTMRVRRAGGREGGREGYVLRPKASQPPTAAAAAAAAIMKFQASP